MENLSKKQRLRNILDGIPSDGVREFVYRVLLGLHSCLKNLGNKWRIFIKAFRGGNLDASSNNHEIYQNEDYGIEALAGKNLPGVANGAPGEGVFLGLAFVNLAISLGRYEQVIEFGAYDGSFSAHLAKLHPEIHIHALDIIPGIETLQELYGLSNLSFHHGEFPGDVLASLAPGKTLFFVKSSLCCLEARDLEILLEKISEAGMDLALMEPCSYVLNKNSRLMSVSRKTGGHILYSHPYSKLLDKMGYDIAYNSQKVNLSLLYQSYYPYYLTYMYAVNGRSAGNKGTGN